MEIETKSLRLNYLKNKNNIRKGERKEVQMKEKSRNHAKMVLAIEKAAVEPFCLGRSQA